MYSAIQDEVNKINNPSIENEEDTSLALEEMYNKLQDTKFALEDLDTNNNMEDLTDADFDKLKDLVVEGNSLVESYRNILPASILSRVKETLKSYEDEIIGAIMDSDNAEEYRANIDL